MSEWIFKKELLADAVIFTKGRKGVRACAKEIGISPATFQRLCHGWVPDIKTLLKICRWINCDPGFFFGAEKDKP